MRDTLWWKDDDLMDGSTCVAHVYPMADGGYSWQSLTYTAFPPRYRPMPKDEAKAECETHVRAKLLAREVMRP